MTVFEHLSLRNSLEAGTELSHRTVRDGARAIAIIVSSPHILLSHRVDGFAIEITGVATPRSRLELHLLKDSLTFAS
jgi:hypothetical protein